MLELQVGVLGVADSLRRGSQGRHVNATAALRTIMIVTATSTNRRSARPWFSARFGTRVAGCAVVGAPDLLIGAGVVGAQGVGTPAIRVCSASARAKSLHRAKRSSGFLASAAEKKWIKLRELRPFTSKGGRWHVEVTADHDRRIGMWKKL